MHPDLIVKAGATWKHFSPKFLPKVYAAVTSKVSSRAGGEDPSKGSGRDRVRIGKTTRPISGKDTGEFNESPLKRKP